MMQIMLYIYIYINYCVHSVGHIQLFMITLHGINKILGRSGGTFAPLSPLRSVPAYD
jgi:hypothetical protein